MPAVSAPASLLIMGEYAILDEGGEGIAMATAPRLRAALTPAADFSVLAIFGGSRLEWSESHPETSPLIACCLASARSRLASNASGNRHSAGPGGASLEGLRGRVVLDASAFFDAKGTKLGLGSSAATAVALSALLLAAGGLEGRALEDAVFPVALAAHRAHQGNRGSGYDIAASRWGGVGLFTGGVCPSWTAVPTELLPPFRLARGPAPVDSGMAIRAYERWRNGAPSLAERYAASSSERARRFLSAVDPRERRQLLAEAAEAGEELGDRIGVPAQSPAEIGSEQASGPILRKALGAGNELIALFFERRTGPAGPAREIRAEAGLRWE